MNLAQLKHSAAAAGAISVAIICFVYTPLLLLYFGNSFSRRVVFSVYLLVIT